MDVWITLIVAILASSAFFIIRLSAMKRALWKLAYTDQLTGLYNLKSFKERSKKLIKENKSIQYDFVLIDIIKFNLINHMYGFNEGNRVIVCIADEINAVAKKMDGVAARVGDDFFVAMIKNSEGGVAFVESMMVNIKENVLKNTHHNVRFSVGRYTMEMSETDVDSIYEKVNYAHRLAKQNNDVEMVFDYSESMRSQAVRQREIEQKMDKALENHEFVVYLQPKYRLHDNVVMGAEALVRWQEDGGKDMVSPGEFIPLFEKNGFIIKLDMYMFEQSCKLIRGWIDNNLPATTISVNFSRLHLGNPNYVQELIDIVDKYGISRRYLEIEITESTMIENENLIEDVVTKLHEAGFVLSIDDFGTGYSSLGLLKNLQADIIKIDRSFFDNNRYKTRAKTVIMSVINMANELGIKTLAEGVETKEHVDFLHEIGCESVQGFYFARPLEASKFHDVIRGNYKEIGKQRETLTFADLGDIAKGRENLKSDMPVLVYRLFEFAVRQTLSETYGKGEMEIVLRNAGRLAGHMFAAELLDTTLDLNEFLEELKNKMVELKMGFFTLEEIDEKTGHMIMTVSEDLDCSGTENTGEVLCHYDEGLIAGILKEYTSNSYIVTEVDCWGKGDDTCRFNARPLYNG